MKEMLSVRVPDRLVLSDECVRSLIAEAQQGNVEARNKLVEGNLRLVLSIVQRFKGRGHEADDLFQVGCVGLIHAIERFDLTYDVAFSTYAVPCILGEIHRYLRESHPVKVGRTLRSLSLQANDARERLTQRLGRSPKVEEIAEAVGASREDVLMALEIDQPPTSLDQPIDLGEGSPIFLRDQLTAEAAEDIESMALMQVLESLNAEERVLVTMRYLRQMSQTQVAAALCCSQASVSRMERRVIERMRRLWYS